ncbi:MAG: Rieske (2Fe-2S) protein [Chloroflexota bacterium]
MSQAPRYVAVAPVAAVRDGERREFDVDGQRLIVVNLGGEYYALASRCPHQGGPLGRGQLEDGVLVCPWHLWRFDARTGRARWPEGYTRIACYPVKIEDGQIVVSLS